MAGSWPSTRSALSSPVIHHSRSTHWSHPLVSSRDSRSCDSGSVSRSRSRRGHQGSHLRFSGVGVVGQGSGVRDRGHTFHSEGRGSGSHLPFSAGVRVGATPFIRGRGSHLRFSTGHASGSTFSGSGSGATPSLRVRGHLRRSVASNDGFIHGVTPSLLPTLESSIHGVTSSLLPTLEETRRCDPKLSPRKRSPDTQQSPEVQNEAKHNAPQMHCRLDSCCILRSGEELSSCIRSPELSQRLWTHRLSFHAQSAIPKSFARQ